MNARVTDSIEASEISSIAKLHVQAFPNFFLSSLGTAFLEEFYAGFLVDETAIVSVARDSSGKPIAVAVGSTEPTGFFRRLLMRRWWGFTVASLGACVRNPLVLPRLLGGLLYRGGNSRPPSSALLSSICVSPDCQGEGLGLLILNAWSARAKHMGAKSAYLTTDAENNAAANGLYLRAGWELIRTARNGQGRAMNMYRRDFATENDGTG